MLHTLERNLELTNRNLNTPVVRRSAQTPTLIPERARGKGPQRRRKRALAPSARF
jgi:hypothetical protein